MLKAGNVLGISITMQQFEVLWFIVASNHCFCCSHFLDNKHTCSVLCNIYFIIITSETERLKRYSVKRLKNSKQRNNLEHKSTFYSAVLRLIILYSVSNLSISLRLKHSGHIKVIKCRYPISRLSTVTSTWYLTTLIINYKEIMLTRC